MKTALIGGTRRGSSRCAPTSMMLSVRVPAATRSGRASRAGVLGNANEAPLTRPPPGTPNFPARAGSAKTARMPLPPFWLRSSPLPTLIAAGESAWYSSASRRTTPTGTPQTRGEPAPPAPGAAPAAGGLPAGRARAEPVEETQVHRAGREHPVRARVVERQDRLRAVRGDDRAQALVGQVGRGVPRDRLPRPPAAPARGRGGRGRPGPCTSFG